MRHLYYFIPIILLFPLSAFGDENLEQEGRYESSGLEGRNFLIGFMQNEIDHNGKDYNLQLIFCITSPFDNNIIDIVDNHNNETYKDTLSRNETGVYVAADNLENDEPSVVNSKTLRITAKYPVLVYCYNYFSLSMDSYAALPIESWGEQYSAFSMPLDDYEFSSNTTDFSFVKRKGQVLVMADEDNTTVTYRSPVALDDGTGANVTSTIVLNQGEIYTFEPSTTIKKFGDLTGLQISADKPIGVISGHQRSATNFLEDANAISKDHLAEMLIPRRMWKNEYFTIPFMIGDPARIPATFYKVLSSKSGQVINFEFDGGSNNAMINNLEDHAYIQDLDMPVRWYSDEPFSLMQIMARTQENRYARELDPTFLNALMSEPTSNYLYFYVPRFMNENNNSVISFNDKIGIICTKNAKNFLKHNDRLISDTYTFQSFNNLYDYVIINAAVGVNKLATEEGYFSANSYGFNSQISYAHNITGEYRKSEEINTEFVSYYTEDCFSFEVILQSLDGSTPVDLAWYDLVPEGIENLDYDIEFEPMTDEIKITGTLIDQTENGSFEIEVVDRYGFHSRWSTTIYGEQVTLSEKLSFGSYLIGSAKCIGDEIFNNSDVPITIESIEAPVDDRFFIFPEDLVGTTIEPGESVLISYCLNQEDESLKQLYDTISYSFGCLERSVVVIGDVRAPNTTIYGHDFPLTRIGDSRCANIVIENSGNVTNTITELVWPENSVFQIDTLGRFPIVLQKDEVYDLIGACFIPDSLGSFELEVQAINTEGIPMVDTLRGIAGEPGFQDYSFNFDKTRTGITIEHTFDVNNFGNYEGDLIFLGKEGDSDNSFDISLVIQDVLELEGNQNANKTVSYTPQTPGPHEVKCYFQVDPDYSGIWEHDTVTFTFTGNGLEPSVESYDHFIGEFLIDREHTGQYKVFDISGTDSVHITDMNLLNSGDITADNMISYINLKLFEDELTAEVEYIAQTLGDVSLGIELITDAGFGRSEHRDTAWISARALPYPQFEISSSLATREITSCVENEYRLNVQSSFGSRITDVQLNPESENVVIPADISIYLNQSTLDIPLTILTDNSTDYSGQLKVQAELDTVVAGESITVDTTMIIPISVKPRIPIFTNSYIAYGSEELKDETELAAIGDTITIDYKIDFEHNEDLIEGQSISIEVQYDPQLLFLMDKDIEINLGNNDKITAKINHGISGYTIEMPSEPIISSGADDISFSNQFLVLLHNKLETDIQLIADISGCFLPQLSTYNVKIFEVCDYDLRTVKFLSNLKDVGIHYSSYSKELSLTATAEQSQWVSMELYDVNGKLIHNSTFEIDFGTNTYNTPLEQISSGVYFLRLNTAQGLINRKLSITN